MAADGFWVQVAELKTLGRAHLADVADELGSAARDLGGLEIPGDTFGVPGAGPAFVAGYHDVMHRLEGAVHQTSEQVARVGAAITKIAENYEATDRDLS